MQNDLMLNGDSFSHGQTLSKIWLCETIESHIPLQAKIAVLGAWYNLVSFMILTRGNAKCQSILGIDIDPNVKEIANKINNAWTMGNQPLVKNITCDANSYDLSEFDVVINCSPEHMHSNDWFKNIKKSTLVCIQSSDVVLTDDVWKCVNPNRTIDILKTKYPLTEILFEGTKNFSYGDWGYNRFMIIGFK